MSSSTDPIDRFLNAVLTASIADCAVWAEAATLDATVPNWRFHRRGPDEIRATYTGWFADPAEFTSLRRIAIPGGEVVEYDLTWTEQGMAHQAHHLHVLGVAGGLIQTDVVLCGGRWSASLLAEMAAADAEYAGA